MSIKANELRPTMTKAKALELIIKHVNEKGIPEKDSIVYLECGCNGVDISQWTYQGLCKLLIGE